MASVAKMSHVKSVDTPLRGKPITDQQSSVCFGVNQSKPCAGGQDSIPVTKGLMGNADPLVLSGALFSTEACVGALSPVGRKQGGASLPAGVKQGVASRAQTVNLAQRANLAQTAIGADMASIAIDATQQRFINSLLPDSNAAQTAYRIDTQSSLQNLEHAKKPSTNYNYSYNLPTGKPLSPITVHNGPANVSYKSLGEADVLEIPVQKDIKGATISVTNKELKSGSTAVLSETFTIENRCKPEGTTMSPPEPPVTMFLTAIMLSILMNNQNVPENKKVKCNDFPVDSFFERKNEKHLTNADLNKKNVKPKDDLLVSKVPNEPNNADQNKKSVKKVVNGIRNVATVVKKAMENKKSGNIMSKKDSKNEKKTYSDITKKGGQINKDKEATDKTFNSHPNRSSAQVMENKGEDNISLCSTIISESDWEESTDKHQRRKNTMKGKNKVKCDGPLLLSANPFKNFVETDDNVAQKKGDPLPAPRRIWEEEKIPNNQNYHISNSFPNHSKPVFPSQPAVHSVPFVSRAQPKPSNSDKPNTIREVSCQLISTGDTGEEVIEEKSIYHDDFQVYHSSAYKRKMKRLEKLRNYENNKGLKSAKSKVKTRFILTKLAPESTEEEVELELLDYFEDFEEVYVRKTQMKKHTRYSTFVFIVTSENELDVEAIENSDWPGEVRCFFAPNNERYRQ